MEPRLGSINFVESIVVLKLQVEISSNYDLIYDIFCSFYPYRFALPAQYTDDKKEIKDWGKKVNETMGHN